MPGFRGLGVPFKVMCSIAFRVVGSGFMGLDFRIYGGRVQGVGVEGSYVL